MNDSQSVKDKEILFFKENSPNELPQRSLSWSSDCGKNSDSLNKSMELEYTPDRSSRQPHDHNYATTQKGPSSASLTSDKSVFKSAMQIGFLALSGKLSTSRYNAWSDAIKYCRAVIESPQDSKQRANADWSRSCSVLCKELLTRFGPETLESARAGCKAFINDKYQGRALDIAHVDKRTNAKRYLHKQEVGRLPCQTYMWIEELIEINTYNEKTCDIFSMESSILATACYEQTALCCSILLSAWLPTKIALKNATISHVAVCDDYHAFTITETNARKDMIAVAVGAACESDGQMANLLVDGTALQACGLGHGLSINSIMAWRAVGGCTTPYSSYVWGSESLENGLVAPEVMMAMHDLLDWRSDTAAQNHENGVSALYGLGDQRPFHTYLEAMLNRACTHPTSGAYAMACIVHLHFTSVRYGSYHYEVQGCFLDTCDKCIQLLKVITTEAGLQWAPEPPPDSFAAGEPFRQVTKRAVNNFETHPRAQYGIGWLQYLIVSGRIQLFDALFHIDQVDRAAEWA